jgi:hypothetical protein
VQDTVVETTFLWRCPSPSVKAFASAMTGLVPLRAPSRKAHYFKKSFSVFFLKKRVFWDVRKLSLEPLGTAV